MMSSEEEIVIETIARDFLNVYRELYYIVESIGLSYSPKAIIQGFDRWFKNQDYFRTMNEDQRIDYLINYKVAEELLNFYSDILHLNMKALEALLKIKEGEKMRRDKIKDLVVYPFVRPLERITRKIINEWFVKIVRKIGKIDSPLFDNYNVFREKWNSIINEVEKIARSYGLDLRLEERVKELGVRPIEK